MSRAVFADFATRREDMQANAAHNEAEDEAEAVQSDEAEAVQSDEAEGEDRPDEAHTEAIERLEKLCQHLLTQYEEVAAQCQAACQERDDAVASEAMAEEICEQATAEAARLGVELSRLHRDSMEGAAREAVEQEAAEATEAERGLRLAAEERQGAAQRQAEAEGQRAEAAELRAEAAATEVRDAVAAAEEERQRAVCLASDLEQAKRSLADAAASAAAAVASEASAHASAAGASRAEVRAKSRALLLCSHTDSTYYAYRWHSRRSSRWRGARWRR